MYINFLYVFILFSGIMAISYADSNGIWIPAEDVIGGILGDDQINQDFTVSGNFDVWNNVSVNKTLNVNIIEDIYNSSFYLDLDNNSVLKSLYTTSQVGIGKDVMSQNINDDLQVTDANGDSRARIRVSGDIGDGLTSSVLSQNALRKLPGGGEDFYIVNQDTSGSLIFRAGANVGTVGGNDKLKISDSGVGIGAYDVLINDDLQVTDVSGDSRARIRVSGDIGGGLTSSVLSQNALRKLPGGGEDFYIVNQDTSGSLIFRAGFNPGGPGGNDKLKISDSGVGIGAYDVSINDDLQVTDVNGDSRARITVSGDIGDGLTSSALSQNALRKLPGGGEDFYIVNQDTSGSLIFRAGVNVGTGGGNDKLKISDSGVGIGAYDVSINDDFQVTDVSGDSRARIRVSGDIGDGLTSSVLSQNALRKLPGGGEDFYIVNQDTSGSLIFRAGSNGGVKGGNDILTISGSRNYVEIKGDLVVTGRVYSSGGYSNSLPPGYVPATVYS